MKKLKYFFVVLVISVPLFSGNSVFAFQLEQTLELEPKSNTKYFGVTLAQNFTHRNYTGSFFYDSYDFKNFPNEFNPSISFGVHIEKKLSNHPNSASLKFKLLYEQFNSTLSKMQNFYDWSTQTFTDSFKIVDVNRIKQYSLQASYIQPLFSTNLSLQFGGALAFVEQNHHKQYFELNKLQDTLLFVDDNGQTTSYHKFSEDYSEYIMKDYVSTPDLRYTLHIGIQYDFLFDKVKVVPFIVYNYELNSQNSRFRLNTFQTGLDFSFLVQ